MSVLDEFSDLMTETCTVEPKTASDFYGKRTFGTAITYPCHVMRKRRKIRTAVDREVLADGTVILLGCPTIGPEDRLTVDSGIVTLLAVEPFYDDRGAHHTDLHFGASG